MEPFSAYPSKSFRVRFRQFRWAYLSIAALVFLFGWYLWVVPQANASLADAGLRMTVLTDKVIKGANHWYFPAALILIYVVCMLELIRIGSVTVANAIGKGMAWFTSILIVLTLVALLEPLW